MNKVKKGFTLVELMVVITVIAILMTIAVISFTRVQRQARDTKRKSDIRTLSTALQVYFTEFQKYPVGSGYIASSLTTLTPTYLPTLPSGQAGAAGTFTDYYYVSGANEFSYGLCVDLEIGGTTGTTVMWTLNTANAGGYTTADDGACSPQ